MQTPLQTLQRIALLGSAFLGIDSASGNTTFNLKQGEKKFLSLPEMAQSVTLTKSGIIDVDRGETKAILILKAKQEGNVDARVTLESGKELTYNVTVGGSQDSGEAVERLRRIPGIVVESKGGQVLIKGNVMHRVDLQTLAAIKADFPGVIVDSTNGDLYEGSTLVRTINRILNENDMNNLQAHAYGTNIVLEGAAKDDQQLALALKIARSIHPAIEDSVNRQANGAPSISIEVMFVEVRKVSASAFGIGGLNETLNAGALKTDGVGESAISAKMAAIAGHEGRGAASIDWQVGPLAAFVRLIQQRGGSRLLSNPRLVARSGQEASFQSGGVFYLQSSQETKSGELKGELIPVNYGIELKIVPRIDAIGGIDSKIVTAVSEVGEIMNGMPTLTKSNVETAVTVRNGQSLLLSGLVRKRDSKSVLRVPLLSDIPLVGELFKSRKLQSEEGELFVLVTMRRVSASEERSGSTSQLFERSASDVEFSFFD